MKILYSRYRWFFLCCAVLVLFDIVLWHYVKQMPYWGDEVHFVGTIQYFGHDFSWKNLIHYNEMSGPLPFLLYAGWGHLVGFELNDLRLFSLVISAVTYLAFFGFVAGSLKNQKAACACTLFLLFHPYMVGFSVLVFTDMLPILASILVLYAMRYNQPLLLFSAGVLGLLSRQYFVFFLFAVGLTYLFRIVSRCQRRDVVMAASIILSTLPLCFLAYAWQGFSPKNELNNLYMDESFRFHPEYLTLYILQLSVYLLPLIVVNVKKIYGSLLPWLIAVACSGLYWIFPVKPCPAAVEASFLTVGFFHKFIKFLVGPVAEQYIFWILFTVSIPILVFVVKDLYQRLRSRTYDIIFAIHLSLICFLLILPCSYFLWEKYFMPLVPLFTITWAAFYLASGTKNTFPRID